jgi:transcriptional regulator with XRE-family HTH domain
MIDQDILETNAGGAGEEPWFSPDNSTLGDRLAGAREAAGMSRADLARRLGVKVSTIAKWEDDTAEPRANRLQMLSGILGVSLIWILTANGEAPDMAPRDDTLSKDLRSVLAELRQVQSELRHGVERVSVLEKRLKRILEQSG